MQALVRAATLVLCLSLFLSNAGCASLWTGRSRTRHLNDYLDRLKAKQADVDRYFGHLARGVNEGALLEADPVARPAEALVNEGFVVRSFDLFELSFARSDAKEICFAKRLGIGSDAEQQQEVAALRSDWAFKVEAHTRLEDAAPGTEWPAPVAHTVTRKLDARDPTVEICMPAVTINDQTNFITVAVMPRERDYANYLLVWDFNGQKRQ